MTIAKLLEEISFVPGVSGSCIFDPEQGPMFTDAKMQLSETALQSIGASVCRMLKMGTMNGLKITGGNYRFDNCTVLAVPLQTAAVLLTICDTQVNCSLAMSTSSMLAGDISTLLLKNAAQDADIEQPFDSDIELIDIEEDDGYEASLQEQLDRIEDSLAEAMGPVAEMIMRDNVATWIRQGPAVAARLHELVKLVAAEIGDESLVKEFTIRIDDIF